MKNISKISDLFPKTNKDKKLLAIYAHPDDEALRIGGILYKAYKENIKTYLICLTKGEKGSVGKKIPEEKLRKIRKKELFAAAGVLNITKIYALNFPDGKLKTYQDEVESRLEKLI